LYYYYTEYVQLLLNSTVSLSVFFQVKVILDVKGKGGATQEQI